MGVGTNDYRILEKGGITSNDCQKHRPDEGPSVRPVRNRDREVPDSDRSGFDISDGAT
ncbi:hypothetical protein JCM19992_11190 [Thermostilla marina]